MDYTNLIADRNYWHSNFTAGRDGRALDRIIIHHNAGAHMSDAAVAGAFTARGTSAHYQVDVDGYVVQYVHDGDTAYHCGNWDINCRSIGIEHANVGGAATGWPISAATVEYGAKLVAALCYGYGLGRPEYRVNVFPHSDYFSTACPCRLHDTLSGDYIAQAQAFYDELSGQATEGWVPQDGGWWYRNADGSYPTGWFQVNGKWYFANTKGWLQAGWLLSNGKWYFLHDTHDTRYGEMETGWVKPGEQWFYLDPAAEGAMATGWALVDGEWYFLESNGAMRTGWLQEGEDRYFLLSSGRMARGGVFQTRFDGGCTAFAADGKMLRGEVLAIQDDEGVMRLSV